MKAAWLIALTAICFCRVCVQVATAQTGKNDDSDAVLSVVIPASVADAYGKWPSYSTYKQYLLAKHPDNQKLESGCIVVPDSKREAYESLLANYEKLEQHPLALDPHLSLDKPYRMLEQQDVRRVQSCSQGIRSACDDQFSFAPGIVYVSNVAFNSDRTLALVWVNNWCGTLCGKGAWHVLARTDGKWVEQPVVRCVGWS